ncbi:hypothetical protein CsSME_00035293 [Camellia sinensis var. sinensis]
MNEYLYLEILECMHPRFIRQAIYFQGIPDVVSETEQRVRLAGSVPCVTRLTYGNNLSRNGESERTW